jgi:hypothetical protein
MPGVLVNRKELCEAFDFVKWVVPLKPIIAADGNVSLRVSGEYLVISSCDGVMGAKALVPLLNKDEAPQDFYVGCDPKRFGKAIAKDTAESISLAKVAENLHVSDPAEGEDKFITLACANMKRASLITVWVPTEEECLNNVSIAPLFFSQVLAFLDNFTTDGKEGNGRHDVIALGESVAHTTNGVNLRGICASKALAFKSEVCIRKRYMEPLIKVMQNMGDDPLSFKDGTRIISLTSADGRRSVVFPTMRKPPPVVPKEYLTAMGDCSVIDVKEVSKGLDRMSTSNYNTASILAGIDIKIFGEGPDSKMQLILEENKASQAFALSRKGNETIVKTIDLNTLLMILKSYTKGTSPKIYFGDDETRYLRFVDLRTTGSNVGAFIAVCSYARKV